LSFIFQAKDEEMKKEKYPPLSSGKDCSKKEEMIISRFEIINN